jgi:hypothetical protein
VRQAVGVLAAVLLGVALAGYDAGERGITLEELHETRPYPRLKGGE